MKIITIRFNIKCIKCQASVCSSDDIALRGQSQLIVVDPTIWQRVLRDREHEVGCGVFYIKIDRRQRRTRIT